MKKLIFTGVMSSLTVAAASACKWQYRRYNESIIKWEKIDKLFSDDYVPPSVSISDILNLSAEDYNYNMITTSGELGTDFKMIWRYNEGRPGAMLCGVLLNNDEGIIVNLGWVPEQYVNYEHKLAGQQITMKALVKKPEYQDYLKNKEFKGYIDLQEMATQAQLGEKSQKVYLERIGEENETGGLFKNEDLSLYPVPVSKATFSKPYLTPDKHKSYCAFWGSCTALGIYSILKVARK